MTRPVPKITKAILVATRKRMKHSRLSALLGFHVKSLAPGRAVLTMQVKELHKQIHDVVHGGVLAALADTAAAIAAFPLRAAPSAAWVEGASAHSDCQIQLLREIVPVYPAAARALGLEEKRVVRLARLELDALVDGLLGRPSVRGRSASPRRPVGCGQ